MASTPQNYFQQEFYTYLNKENPRFNGVMPTDKSWADTDYKLAYEKYKERFANAADEFSSWKCDDASIEPPYQQINVDLGYRMLRNRSCNVTIMFYGDAKYSAKDAMSMQALGEVLTIKLIEQLRENESGVYGVSARGIMNKIPNGSYSFNIGFPCGPDNAEKLTASALKELQNIIDNGPDEKM
jgi:zinc protease